MFEYPNNQTNGSVDITAITSYHTELLKLTLLFNAFFAIRETIPNDFHLPMHERGVMNKSEKFLFILK